MCYKLTWSPPFNNYKIHHGGSDLQRTHVSRNTVWMCLDSWTLTAEVTWPGNTSGHLGSHSGSTSTHSRLYLSLFLVLFQARKAPQIHFKHLYVPHDTIAAKTMLPGSRAHPQVYCVQIWC